MIQRGFLSAPAENGKEAEEGASATPRESLSASPKPNGKHPPHRTPRREEARFVSQAFTSEIVLYEGLRRAYPDLAVLRKPPFPIAEGQYAEPAVLVLRNGLRFYARPFEYGPSDVLLVAEVFETSADPIREERDRFYAAAEIPEFWSVHLDAGTVVRAYAPTPHGYSRREISFRGDEIGGMPVSEIVGEPSLSPAAGSV